MNPELNQPKSEPLFTESKIAFVTLQNTDLTEGRGSLIPLAISWSKTTALRIGRGKDVQGCDCRVEETTLYRIRGRWFGPVVIQTPSQADHDMDAARAKREAAVAKAKKAGLSEKDIEELYLSIIIPS